MNTVGRTGLVEAIKLQPEAEVNVKDAPVPELMAGV